MRWCSWWERPTPRLPSPAPANPPASTHCAASWRPARNRGRRLRSWRLTGLTLVVTLEPCTMCAGALVLARVARLIFGAFDPKAGAVSSLFDVVRDPRLNHRVEVRGGVLEDECGALLKAFFANR